MKCFKLEIKEFLTAWLSYAEYFDDLVKSWLHHRNVIKIVAAFYSHDTRFNFSFLIFAVHIIESQGADQSNLKHTLVFITIEVLFIIFHYIMLILKLRLTKNT